MQHTRILSASAAALTLALVLASCGGGGTPTDPNAGTKPQPGTEQPGPAAELPPVQGGTIARPADAVAANEFVISGVKAVALAQSLGFDTRPQASVKTAMAAGKRGAFSPLLVDGRVNELRVLLAVTKAKTGDNAGKKKATATFVWGNQDEKVIPFSADTKNSPAIVLDIYPDADDTQKTTYKGGLNLEVKGPNFQAKTTRSGEYVADTGAMCAQLVVNLVTAQNSGNQGVYTPFQFDTASSPVEVCEGVSERDAEKVALEKAAKGLTFTAGSLGAASFTYTRQDGATALPADAAGLAAVAGTDASATVTTSTTAAFFAPLTALPAGPAADWTPEEKAAATIARKYAALEKQFGYHFTTTQVYTVATSAGRDDIVILGMNGWGVGGLKTIRFK